MAGVYGDMLSSFNELFRTVKFWEASTDTGAGYQPKEIVEFRVIILATRSASFQEKKVADYKALDISNRDVLYSRDDTPIKVGMFLMHPDENEVFRVDVPINYAFTGGYKTWGITRVQGANGMNQQKVEINSGYF